MSSKQKYNKILVVFGTRPEAIKIAPVIKELKATSACEIIVCVTGQHKEMLNQVLELFKIEPDYNLAVMKENQTLTSLTSKLIEELDVVIKKEKPGCVIVHGDTTTAMVASLSAFYNQTDVAHVEAGLRTNDIYSPWPEEFNRQSIGLVAKYHFAPTSQAESNLLKAGVQKKQVFVTGNTVIDALIWVSEQIDSNPSLNKTLQADFSFLSEDKKMILVTGHRRENFGQGFLHICEALAEVAQNNPNVEVVYPVHLNPNVKKPVHDLLENIPNIHLIEPQPYLHFVYLLKKSHIILTDSGGVQEEAPSLGKPVLVMREVTERPEAVMAGTVKLVGTDKNKIISNITKLLNDNELYEQMRRSHNPYGDGLASRRIAKELTSGE